MIKLGEMEINADENAIIYRGVHKLSPKSMHVFKLLIDQKGSVISRQELIEQVWPNRYGADESLSKSISELRKVLKKAQKNLDKSIETIPKGGYKFNEERLLDIISHSSTHQAQYKTPKLKSLPAFGALFALFIVLIGAMWSSNNQSEGPRIVESVMVAPFKNLTQINEIDNQLAGLSHVINNELASFLDVKVLSQSSTNYFIEKEKDILLAAQKAQVSHVIHGSLISKSNRLQLSVSLIETQSGFTVWTDVYDFEAPEFQQVQDQIANNISHINKVFYTPTGQYNYKTLSPSDYAILLAALEDIEVIRPSRSPDKSARMYRSAHNQLNLIASKYDNYIPALTTNAILTLLAGHRGTIKLHQAVSLAESLIKKAEAESAKGTIYLSAKAYLLYTQGKLQIKDSTTQASLYAQSFELATKALDDNYKWVGPYYVLSYLYQAQNEPYRSLDIINEGIKALPHDLSLHSTKVNKLLNLGDFQAAEAAMHELCGLYPPDAFWKNDIHRDTHIQFAKQTKNTEAFVYFNRVASNKGNSHAYNIKADANWAFLSGNSPRAIQLLSSLAELYESQTASAIGFLEFISQNPTNEEIIQSLTQPTELTEPSIRQMLIKYILKTTQQGGTSIPAQHKAAIERAVSLLNTPYKALISEYMSISDNDSAIQVLNEMAHQGDSFDDYFQLAEAMALRQNSQAALRSIELAVQKKWKFTDTFYYLPSNSPFLAKLKNKEVLSLIQNKLVEFERPFLSTYIEAQQFSSSELKQKVNQLLLNWHVNQYTLSIN